MDNNLGHEVENRKNEDKEVNDYGRKIIGMCREMDMVVLNGRCKSNEDGEFTYVAENGKSVIDLVIIKVGLYEQDIIDMRVTENVEKSKHFEIEILVANDIEEATGEVAEYLPLELYKWNNLLIDQFKSQLNDKKVELWIIGIEESVRRNEVTQACKIMDSMYKWVGGSMKVKHNKKYWERKNNWFDWECRKAKHIARNALRVFRRMRMDAQKRNYLELKQEYVDTCKRMKEEFRIINKDKLSRMIEEKDEVNLWKVIRQRKNETNGSEGSGISGELWLEHYDQIYRKKTDNGELQIVERNDIMEIEADPHLCNEIFM